VAVAAPLRDRQISAIIASLYRQQWRSYARRELRGGERLFALKTIGFFETTYGKTDCYAYDGTFTIEGS
jgi:hypothetical protein